MRRRALAAQQAMPFKIAGDGPTPLLPERPDFVLAPAQVERRHTCHGAARGDGCDALQQARAPTPQQAELIKRLVSAARKGDCYIASGRHVYLVLQSCPKAPNIIIAELQYSVVASGLGCGLFPHLYESTKRSADGPSHRSDCLKNDGRGRTTCTTIAKRASNCSSDGFIQALGLNECQVKGAGRNGAFVLASAQLYQSCFLTNYREGKPLTCIKDHLDCARWRIPSC